MRSYLSKILVTLTSLLAVFIIACDNNDLEWSDYKEYEITIASSHPFDNVDSGYYMRGFHDDQLWEILYDNIDGFDELYEEGYEYIIKISARYRWGDDGTLILDAKLIEVISKTHKQSDIPKH